MPNKTIGLIALLAGLTASELMAGDLTSYATGDVLICFRNGGQNDLVADAGQISTFTNLAPNTRVSISAYTSGMLHYVSTNSVSWSAFTWLADNTLYVTRARTSPDVQATPWQANTGGSQGLTSGRMATIPPGTVDEVAYIPPGAGSSPNTATAVVEGDLSADNTDYVTGQSYRDALLGNFGGAFNGSFRGSPEFTTASTFTKASVNARADLFQMTPTSGFGQGKFLGYFELSTNGSMSYVAYPNTVPIIKSISRVGNVNTITYTTGTYGNYILRATNVVVATGLKTSWPAVQTLNAGDTTVHTCTDTTTDPMKFYSITAQ
jgi:hypothetical protein